MRYANVQLNWNTTFQVPVSDLSKFLETINKYPLVKSEYDEKQKKYYCYCVDEKNAHIELTNERADAEKRVKQQEETTAGLTD